MAVRRPPTDITEFLQKLEDRLRDLEHQVNSRVLPDLYRWELSGGDLYLRNLDTGALTGPIN